MLNKRCRLLKTYPTFTVELVRKRMTSAQGWAYYNWAVENEATIWGETLKRKTPGYVAQEVERQNHG